MATRVEIRPTTREDILYLAANMRDADRRELEASSNLDPITALELSVSHSREPLTGLADGELVCCFGVVDVSLLHREGVPWMVATPAIEQHGKIFLLNSRRVVKKWRRQYRYMSNFVDVRNDIAITWLKWLGFKLHAPIPYGPRNMPFHPFIMEVA